MPVMDRLQTLDFIELEDNMELTTTIRSMS